MARAFTLGNGTLLVGIDADIRVRDLYYPYVGEENHLGPTSTDRVGIFADSTLSWIERETWDITIASNPELFRGESTAKNKELGVKVSFTDVVYNERPVFLRKVKIKNLRTEAREIKIFFGQEFVISESVRGDTGFFDPATHSIIHYKGHRAFLVNAKAGDASFDEYTTGLYEIEGRDGSYRDAEDGKLSKNPIEHGKVDSTIGLTLSLAGSEEKTVYYWIAVGKLLSEAKELNAYVEAKTPEHLIETSGDFWKAWVNRRNFNFFGLSEDSVALFKKSLFLMRSHAAESGALIASSDSEMLQYGRDTYTYMWPRDAALIASSLTRAGDFNVAQRFFRFTKDIIEDGGYFMHKYRPDGSLGSSWHPWMQDGKSALPIQEDETSLVIWSLFTYYKISKDIELVEELYNPLIKKAAGFLMAHTDAETGLSAPSYDLWEERYGIHTFTVAAKFGALFAAAGFAKILGKTEEEAEFLEAAARVKDAIIEHLYNEEKGSFYKSIRITNDGKRVPDTTEDSSSPYGIWHFGVLPADDRRVVKAMHNLEKAIMQDNRHKLEMPRYAGDAYFRSGGPETPPNTWIVTTLWRARYLIRRAKNEKDLEEVKRIINWAVKSAFFNNSLPEQVDPKTGAPLSATPLMWSHAEYVKTIINYLERLEELGICEMCYPLGENKTATGK